MAEENQAQQEPKEPQQVQQEPQQVTTKDPKKVEAGKRLAAINRKKRKAKKREERVQLEKTASGVNQYYGIGTVIALGVIGSLGYYIYWSKKGSANREVIMPVSQQPHPQTNKIKSFPYYKNGQEEYIK